MQILASNSSPHLYILVSGETKEPFLLFRLLKTADLELKRLPFRFYEIAPWAAILDCGVLEE